MKKLILALNALIFIIISIFFTNPVYASPMLYNYSLYNTSGEVCGVSFVDRNVSFKFVGDTDDIYEVSGPWWMDQRLDNLFSAEVVIEGINSFDLTDEWILGNNNGSDFIFANVINRDINPGIALTLGFEPPSLAEEFDTGIIDVVAIISPQEGFGVSGGTLYLNNHLSGQYSAHFVPIPSAVWLLGSGLIGLVGFRKKFRKEA